jgi:hypothetical protein
VDQEKIKKPLQIVFSGRILRHHHAWHPPGGIAIGGPDRIIFFTTQSADAAAARAQQRLDGPCRSGQVFMTPTAMIAENRS